MRKLASILLSVVLLLVGFPNMGVHAELYEWAQLGGNSMREGRVEVMPDIERLTIIWESSVKWPEDDSPMMIKAAPITEGERIFVAAANIPKNRGRIVTVDKDTGKTSTFLTSPAPFLSTPVIHNNNLYAPSGVNIYEQNLDGQKNTSFVIDPDHGGLASESSGLFNGTYAVFATKLAEKNVVCIRTEDASRMWQAGILADVNTDICSWSGKILVPADDEKMYAVDEYTGEIEWVVEVSGGFSASPMVLSSMLVMPVRGFGVRALDVGDGVVLWEHQMTNLSVMPCTDGRMLFFGCEDGSFQGFDVDNNEIEWTFSSDSKITSAPVYGSGIVCFGNENGDFFFLNSDTGEVIKKFNFSSIPTAQPLVLNDRVIVACSNGRMFCLGINEGEEEPPEPEPPEPEPVIPATLKIIAPDKVAIDSKIEIAVDVVDANKLFKSEFGFVYDSSKLEFVEAKAGNFLFDGANPPSLITDARTDEVLVLIQKGVNENCPKGSGRLVTLTFIPRETGTHDLTILDAIHTDEDGKTSEPQIETDSFEVVESEVPAVEFLLSPAIYDLGLILSPQTEWLQLTQKNGTATDFQVRVSDEKLEFGPRDGTIAGNDFVDIFFTVDPGKFPPGMSYQKTISVNISGKTLKCDIFFSTPPKKSDDPDPEPEPEPEPVEPPPCIQVQPENLDFGFVPRGREISIDFVLNFDTDEEVSGVISTDKRWLRVSPSTFKTRGNSVSGIVTISASELPGGDSFIGHLLIKSKDNICRNVTVEARVETQPSIILEMDIGIKQATIGSLRVNLDQPPILRNDRTLVPIRFISEAFGSKVQWEASTKKITITRFDDSITLWIGDKSAVINGKRVTLDVEPSIENGSTIVPIRFISESFGASVEWFHATKHIKITYIPPPDFVP
jgi:outer membrane protein assembly factor BamB